VGSRCTAVSARVGTKREQLGYGQKPSRSLAGFKARHLLSRSQADPVSLTEYSMGRSVQRLDIGAGNRKI